MKRKTPLSRVSRRTLKIVHRPKTESLLGYWIAEVWYDGDARPVGYNEDPYQAQGDVPDELYEDVCSMMNAFDSEPLSLDYVDYLITRKQETGN
jgi:hypothetical protein